MKNHWKVNYLRKQRFGFWFLLWKFIYFIRIYWTVVETKSKSIFITWWYNFRLYIVHFWFHRVVTFKCCLKKKYPPCFLFLPQTLYISVYLFAFVFCASMSFYTSLRQFFFFFFSSSWYLFFALYSYILIFQLSWTSPYVYTNVCILRFSFFLFVCVCELISISIFLEVDDSTLFV